MTPQSDLNGASAGWRDRMLPPAWRTRWEDARRQAGTRWQRMTRREQRMVQAMATVLTVWLVAQLAVLPAWRDVVRHSGALPALRAQAAQVDALVQESLALDRQRGAQVAADAIDTELAGSWRAAAIGGEPVIVAVPGAQPAWTITFERAQATALVDWLAYGPSALRLSVHAVKLERDRDPQGKPVAGRVSGTLRLHAGEPEPRV